MAPVFLWLLAAASAVSVCNGLPSSLVDLLVVDPGTLESNLLLKTGEESLSTAATNESSGTAAAGLLVTDWVSSNDNDLKLFEDLEKAREAGLGFGREHQEENTTRAARSLYRRSYRNRRRSDDDYDDEEEYYSGSEEEVEQYDRRSPSRPYHTSDYSAEKYEEEVESSAEPEEEREVDRRGAQSSGVQYEPTYEYSAQNGEEDDYDYTDVEETEGGDEDYYVEESTQYRQEYQERPNYNQGPYRPQHYNEEPRGYEEEPYGDDEERYEVEYEEPAYEKPQYSPKVPNKPPKASYPPKQQYSSPPTKSYSQPSSSSYGRKVCNAAGQYYSKATNCHGSRIAYLYDAKARSCRATLASASCIQSSNSLFGDLATCAKTCGGYTPGKSDYSEKRKGKYQKKDASVCLLPRSHGNGPFQFVSWYFDSHSYHCQPFEFTGYFGNPNIFTSRQECLSTCKQYLRGYDTKYITQAYTSGKPAPYRRARAPIVPSYPRLGN